MQATYDSNIFIQQNNAKSDLYFTLAPTFALGSGGFTELLESQRQAILQTQSFANADLIRLPVQPFYYLLYIPSYTAFIDHTDQNSFDHDVSGSAQVILQRLTLGAFARFQTLRVADVDIGTRTREQWTSARAYALYKLSERTQLNADVFVQNRSVQNFISSFEVWNEDWLDYAYSGKTSLGAGIATGLVIPSIGPEERYGRIQARATWNASRKISVAAKAGVELREVSGSGEKVYPIFGLEAQYTITSRTLSTFSVYQQIRSSADQEALIYVARGLNISIQQKVLDRYLLGAAVGYSDVEYDSFTRTPGAMSRSDNFFYANSNFQVILNRWVDSQLGIEFRKNASTRAGSSFNEFLATWAVRLKF